ncbi:hypothetical protein AB0L75_27870 [Streptomyces sp. NPDC052101]|uniref:hypothetical protein n=1 Tax=Streptomyces sp. NPDC052101 TaxID=3155763 RepID=UPI00342F9431
MWLLLSWFVSAVNRAAHLGEWMRFPLVSLLREQLEPVGDQAPLETGASCAERQRAARSRRRLPGHDCGLRPGLGGGGAACLVFVQPWPGQGRTTWERALKMAFDEITMGRYNVLPTTTKLPYTLPAESSLRRIPDCDAKDKQVFTAWDTGVSKTDIEKEMSLEEAYQALEANTKALWPNGDFDRKHVVAVHANWQEKPSGAVGELADMLMKMWGWPATAATVAAMKIACGRKDTKPYPSAFVGKLVGAAPYVTGMAAVQGKVTKQYVNEETVTVTSTTTEQWEAGLSMTAGVNVKGVKVERTASFKWTKTRTDSTTIAKMRRESTDMPVEAGEWKRLDVRANAGLYSGWLVYFNGLEGGQLAMYPARVPIHAPGQIQPVSEHILTARAGAFNDTQRALAEALHAAEHDYFEAVTQLAQLDGHYPTSEQLTRTVTAELEVTKLRQAAAVLGLQPQT